jgi:hypothetical protein
MSNPATGTIVKKNFFVLRQYATNDQFNQAK